MPANRLGAAAAIVAATTIILGCSTRDTSRTATTQDSAAGSSSAATAGAPSSAPSGTTVRGTVVSASDSVLVVSTVDGEVRVALAPPVRVYAREPADLSRVTEHAFVGVTSVPQGDGTQRATEIHIFPEELRGTAEGSFLMPQQGGGARSTMTNGTVAAPRMTNGAARMTNGAVRAHAGGTLTVEYRGGSQTITIPPNVQVTAIAPSAAPLAAGSRVVVLAVRQPGGRLAASKVLLAGDSARAR